MSETSSSSAIHYGTTKPPLWRNVAVLKWCAQLAVLLGVLAVFWFLIAEARTNLAAKSIPVGYDWLDNPANFQLGEGIQTVDTPERSLTMSRALWVGMVNTLRIAALGIIFSTLLGVLVGISRLSKNFVAQRFSSAYVEGLRNIPVLVQIILWLAILGSLGKLTPDTGPIPGWVIVSQKGISLPRVFLADGFYQFAALMLVFVVGIVAVRRQLKRRQDRDGGDLRIGLWTFVLFVISAAIAWAINPIMAFLGPIFGAIEDAWGAVPQGAMQLLLCVIAVVGVITWMRKFLDSKRSPAGLAKLTDDDWFRMIFSAFLKYFSV